MQLQANALSSGASKVHLTEPQMHVPFNIHIIHHSLEKLQRG